MGKKKTSKARRAQWEQQEDEGNNQQTKELARLQAQNAKLTEQVGD